MAFKFSEVNEKRFTKLLTMFPDKRSVILPALYLLQRESGYVEMEGMEYIAEKIGNPVALSHVYGVATFYSMYNKEPVGKHHIQVCSNVSCFISGADEITEHVCKKLNISAGETTKDKKFTVTEVQCLGACGYGPMMQINDDYYEHLTPQKVDEILKSLE